MPRHSSRTIVSMSSSSWLQWSVHAIAQSVPPVERSDMERRMRFLAVERRWQRQERELRVRNLPNARGSAGRAERETGVWRQAVVAVGHGCASRFSLLASRSCAPGKGCG
eukprot:scaffold18124_cov65-Phaeocystis_antarctica.AAC.1